MVRRALFPALLGLFAALSACSAAGPAGTAAEASAGTWIMGNWSGRLHNLTDEPDPLVKETAAKVAFVADPTDKGNPPQTGTFSMAFPDLPTLKSNGTFKPCGQTCLMLEFAESNFNLVGNKGQLSDMDYELAEPGLSLQTASVKIRLTRDAAAPAATPAPGTGTGTGTGKLAGHWTCHDGASRNWLVFIRSDTKFEVEVKEAGAPSLWLSGDMAVVAGDASRDAVLTITSSNLPAAKGLELYPKLGSDIDMSFVRTERVNGALKAAETIPCNKVDNQ